MEGCDIQCQLGTGISMTCKSFLGVYSHARPPRGASTR